MMNPIMVSRSSAWKPKSPTTRSARIPPATETGITTMTSTLSRIERNSAAISANRITSASRKFWRHRPQRLVQVVRRPCVGQLHLRLHRRANLRLDLRPRASRVASSSVMSSGGSKFTLTVRWPLMRTSCDGPTVWRSVGELADRLHARARVSRSAVRRVPPASATRSDLTMMSSRSLPSKYSPAQSPPVMARTPRRPRCASVPSARCATRPGRAAARAGSARDPGMPADRCPGIAFGISSTATRAASISGTEVGTLEVEPDLARVAAVDVEQRAALHEHGVSGKPTMISSRSSAHHFLDVARVRRIDDRRAAEAAPGREVVVLDRRLPWCPRGTAAAARSRPAPSRGARSRCCRPGGSRKLFQIMSVCATGR